MTGRNYECCECEREEYITRDDLMEYSSEDDCVYCSGDIGFRTCEYCEGTVCSECEEEGRHLC